MKRFWFYIILIASVSSMAFGIYLLFSAKDPTMLSLLFLIIGELGLSILIVDMKEEQSKNKNNDGQRDK